MAHRDAFGPQMQRTFEDCYWHATQTGRAGIGFWLALLWDEGLSIVREHAAAPQDQKRLDNLLFGLVVIWTFGVLFMPTAPALKDWRNLLVRLGSSRCFCSPSRGFTASPAGS
jgi:hypothetical protein